MVLEGKDNFTGCVSSTNPVQRGHNSCKSPGVNNLNPLTHTVDENSTATSSPDKKRGVPSSKQTSQLRLKGSCCGSAANAANDKYALELNTSLKDIKMQIAKKSDGNTLCMRQNNPTFGFIPIYGLGSRVMDRNQGSVCKDILQLHELLRLDGRHNFRGLQIPVASKLNYDIWGKYLTEYWDWQLPLLIKYGFPLDFDRDMHLTSDKINHKSATGYPDHVNTYLKE